MEKLYQYLPEELVTFILVTVFSLLIGLSLRRISLKREGETTLFGTDRTFTFIGMLCYLLYILAPVDYRLFMGGALIGVSMPVFMTALVLQYLFAFKFKWFPVSGFDSIRAMILPAIVLGWNSAGSIARMTRSNLVEIMQNDFIRTARAKGLLESGVIVKHALKNAMLPVVTMMALQVSSMLSGAVLTESVFGVPGIGRLAVNAIETRDMPLLQGTVIFTTILIIVGNLVADLLYNVLDPRIREGA